MNREDSRREYRRRAVLGIALYLILALAPVVFMLLHPHGLSRGLLREFSVALGFCTIGLFGMQFAVAARFQRLKAPYGIDAVYYFHRKIAVVALGLAIAHPVLLFIDSPDLIELLNVLVAPDAARYALASLAATAVIIVVSLWRVQLNLPYETWRGLHNVLSVAILLFASLHIVNTGIYTGEWDLWVFLVYPAIWAGLLGYVRLGKPLRQLRRPYRVEDVRQESADVWTLSMRPQGHRGIRFRPGQFAWFRLRHSPFSLHEHPFSFSSAPARGDGGFEITVKELGDFTSTIGRTKPGATVYVDGPFGAFTTDRYPSSSHVFVAGGIGITPVMSILRSAEATGDTSPHALIYGAATREDLVFAEELDRLSGSLDLRITYVLEEPPEDWGGPTGFITRDVLAQAIEDPGAHEYFVCGPPPMIEAVEGSLSEMEVAPRQIHYERFAFV